MQMITDIQIDLYGEEQYYLASAKQGDKATRFLRVQLMNNGNEFQIPDDVTLIANIQKPDGKFCYNECERENNRVMVKLTNQALAAAGTAHCDIEMRTKSGELILSSAAFTIEIEKSMRNENAILSCNEMTALDRKVQEYIDKMMAARKQVLDTEEAVKIAESARVKAEEDRVQEENSREQAEAERTKEEEARKKAEAGRIAAENIRLQQLQQMKTATTQATQAAQDANTAAGRAEEICRTEEELSDTLNSAKYYYEQSKNIYDEFSGTEKVTGIKGDAETSYRHGNVNITKANIGLGNVGNFKAVSTVASQGLSDAEKVNARKNIGVEVVRVNEKGTNLNDYLMPGVYFFDTNVVPVNIPNGVGNGWLIVMIRASGDESVTKQIWLRLGTVNSSDYQTYVRTKNINWSDWKRYAMANEIPAVPSSLPANGGNADTVDGKHASDFLAVTGGTVTGKTYFTGETYFTRGTMVAKQGGTGGVQGYVKLVQIKIMSNYVNSPIIFEVCGRGWAYSRKLYVYFASRPNFDPPLSDFIIDNTMPYTVAIVKSAQSTWDIYMNKSEPYGSCYVCAIHETSNGLSISYPGEQVSELPSGAIYPTVITWEKAKDADTVDGKHASDLQNYNNLSNKPSIPAAVAVKGNAESSYRTGNINLTPENLGITVVNNTADKDKSVKYANSAGSVAYSNVTGRPTFSLSGTTLTISF